MTADAHSRTITAKALQLLYREAPIDVEKQNRRTILNLKKRLQRGKKFFTLCKVLGSQVLGFVPEICVSRIDLIKLSELRELREQGEEKAKVNEILKSMAQRTSIQRARDDD